jgi:hypothetical protein
MSANKPVIESAVTDSTIRSVVTSPFVAPIIFDTDAGLYLRPEPYLGFKYISPNGDLYKRPQ